MEIELGERNPLGFRSSVMGFVPTERGSTFFMGWHKDYSKFVSRFLSSLSLAKGALPEFLFQYAIAVTENIFINPNWYDKIGDDWREAIERYFRETTRAYADFTYRTFPGIFANNEYQVQLRTNALKIKIWARKRNFSRF